MVFKARRYVAAALVVPLFVLTHIAAMGYSAPPAKIVFTSMRDGNYEIYVMDSNGGNQVNLTDDPAVDWDPTWSPGGDRIAYVAFEKDVSNTIDSMTADGKHLKQLSENGLYVHDPDWFDPRAWSVSPTANFATIWGEIKTPKSARR